MMRPMKRISELVSEIIPDWSWFTWTGLRSNFRVLASRFWGRQPAYDNTIVNYDLARQLYRNDGAESALGASFCKPVINLAVDFIGVPTASTDNPILDDFLNECLHKYWGSELKQVFRNAMRDSKTILRLRLPDINDPLMTMEEQSYGCLETIEPERCVLQKRPGNDNIIDIAYIDHKILIVEDSGDIENGVQPAEREHEILEIIDSESFRYFDKTDRVWLTSMEMSNPYGIIPLVEVFNEYDSSLSGGQSDLESFYPFVKALHDVINQGLQAHTYHSVPKAKFRLNDIQSFIANNFPSAIDEATGKVIPNAEISWNDKSVIFLEVDDDAGFLEAKSVLGDTRALCEFLIDCICVASETPKWAFMLIDSGSANQANNAQTMPFLKKIDRKRIQFAKPIQVALKMIQYVNGYTGSALRLPTISWDTQHPETLASWSQAFQYLVMALEVAAQRQIISDDTYRAILAQYLPQMQNLAQEARDAQNNYDPQAAVAQAQTVNAPPSSGNTNGTGKKENVQITQGAQGKGE
jgi:hypothetical protein